MKNLCELVGGVVVFIGVLGGMVICFRLLISFANWLYKVWPE